MVPDIKTIRIKKNKARNRFRAGVLIFTKYILKRIVRLIRLNNKIKKARNQMADICQKNKNIILDLRKAIKRLNSILEDAILGGGLIRPDKLTGVLEILRRGKKLETHGQES